MLQNLNDITFLVGNKENIEKIRYVPAREVFEEDIIKFLADLSDRLLKSKVARQYSDVMAFAFWIRKASLENTAKIYENEVRIGRGVVFHISPSNIPIQFAVSLVYAMVSGNASIIRISNKEFEQVNILCHEINELLLGQYKIFRPYINIIRYNHNNDITTLFSDMCDARIIWGGNRTIETISNIALPPRAVELKFADRFSIMVIQADNYIEMNHEDVARDFYMDTFFVDQNACSSPRVVIWTGNKIEIAKKIFWNSIQKIVEEKYEYKEISGCEKLLKFTLLASKDRNIRMLKKNNKLVIVKVEKLYPELLNYKGNCGYFFEYETQDLEEVIQILNKQCQTIVSCGVDPKDIRKMIVKSGIYGGDRVVKCGHALDLSFVWDGYDMVRELSRIIM